MLNKVDKILLCMLLIVIIIIIFFLFIAPYLENQKKTRICKEFCEANHVTFIEVNKNLCYCEMNEDAYENLPKGAW